MTVYFSHVACSEVGGLRADFVCAVLHTALLVLYILENLAARPLAIEVVVTRCNLDLENASLEFGKMLLVSARKFELQTAPLRWTK